MSYALYYKSNNLKCETYEYRFNPIDIRSMRVVWGDCETACELTIYLTSKVGKQKFQPCSCQRSNSDDELYTDYINLPFLIKDGTNEKKIQKALLHLQALLKAEDDPFGN